MQKSEKRGLHFGEALLLALPFLALLITFGLNTGKLSFSQWPPQAEMKAGFWLPVIFAAIVYFYVLVNLHARRKGNWKWYREGLISAVFVIIIWLIVAPVFESSIGRIERHKVGIHY